VQEFKPGQRWVSGPELELGLGTVVAVEHRLVTLLFPASGETRNYARQTAPLSRVRFAPGDPITDTAGTTLSVESVQERDGLLTYRGCDARGHVVEIRESALDPRIRLNRPGERLFSHQIDASHLFELRFSTWQHRQRLARSGLYGLTGCRTSLIPHQLYIAHEVGGRHAPRVLLADEVGLGKTIEAGLILHQQLLDGRARRVLVVVPETLLHQWLVEMLRRFNLMFSIFDEARCDAAQGGDTGDNPFHSEQLVLCSLDFLAGSDTRLHQALGGDWDLLVVDEAHHLDWSPRHASREYGLIEQLAARTPGVLLLTATPEQLGRAGHFARLRLLDPHRFPDLQSFIREEEQYQPVAEAVERLLDDTPLDPAERNALRLSLREADTGELLQSLEETPATSAAHRDARQSLVNRLLDHHGTGRILFRNTRAAVRGFPRRRLAAHPLPLPAAYAECLARAADTKAPPETLLYPERLYARSAAPTAWTEIDPRVAWLSATLTALKPHKVLVIAAHARTAVELADALYKRAGLHAAVFHEGLSLLERDRAAAFFADRLAGTQVLICSEIGSEGRNFQFAQHLVLFDLPLHPDLLEQRIGRLDRIGQTGDIQIHVPCLRDSAQSILFDWYHHGLQAFEQTSPAGAQIYDALHTRLFALLRHPRATTQLVEQAAALNTDLRHALETGRDRLLEYNSCRQPAADRLCRQARTMEDAEALTRYMETLLDIFGVDTQPHSEGCYIARPGEHMLHPVPGLPDDGMTVTYDRDIALAFEDARYLSWEHPVTRNTMDLLLGSELGNCSVCVVKYPGVPAGTLLLESIHLIEVSHRELTRLHHPAPVLIRSVLDERGNRHEDRLAPQQLMTLCTPVESGVARQIVQARERVLRELLQRCGHAADARAPAAIAAAGDAGTRTLRCEISRLRALAKVNPAVRSEEIEHLERQLNLLEDLLSSAGARLDAVRVMVAT
jgi:ATP-dependent helicase HepA